MIGILGLIVSLTSLMYFAYRGVNVLILAPICAIVAVLFQAESYAGNGQALAYYTQVFMTSLGKYLITYFPLFLLGAIFGKLMNDTRATQVIGESISRFLGPKHAILATVLACSILTYGGVSLFVVAFCVYPISVVLYEQGGVDKKFIPGAIALGSFTFTMSTLPGTPAIQNAIPMPYFGTTLFAAPGLGIIASLVIFGLGMWWLNHQSAKTNTGIIQESVVERDATLPSVWMSYAPLVIVIVGNYVLSKWVVPTWDTFYLAEPKFGNANIKGLMGLWVLILAVLLAIAFILIFLRKHNKRVVDSMNEGTMDSLLPIFNTASEVGYGSVIAALASFEIVKNAILSIAPSNPLISESIAINALAGITGSASGGLSIGLEVLGARYLELANQMNISPELLHRVASLACGGFDSLPHNGAVISLLTICRLTHKDSYLDIFMVSVVFQVVANVAVVILGTMFGSF